MSNTIIAQSTPIGKGGISVIRMSGEKSLEIAKQIFSCKRIDFNNITPNYMYLGKINLGGIFDKAFMVFFKAPHSFTGEDVVEFHCHGGLVVAEKVITSCLENGAMLASPGEFSKRAFLNGKISLDQAEGIIDTINAQSESQLKASNELIKGNLFKVVNSLQDVLTDVLSEIEVNLDYPEHDIEYETKEGFKFKLKDVLEKISNLLKTENAGKLIKRGVNVAIIGKTNVGKSSLLNAILNYEKAIVTDIEGTTRDIVNGSIEYKGLIFNFFDTAGIRKTDDTIENIGIQKSLEATKNSDIVLLVLDSSKELSSQDLENLELIKNKKSIVILNKCDLPSKIKFDREAIKISAKQNLNVSELKEKIYQMSIENEPISNQIILTNARHIELLKDVEMIFKNLCENILSLPLDCVAIDVKTAWEKLGEITGTTASEVIIDKIFSKFCLGK